MKSFKFTGILLTHGLCKSMIGFTAQLVFQTLND